MARAHAAITLGALPRLCSRRSSIVIRGYHFRLHFRVMPHAILLNPLLMGMWPSAVQARATITIFASSPLSRGVAPWVTALNHDFRNKALQA